MNPLVQKGGPTSGIHAWLEPFFFLSFPGLKSSVQSRFLCLVVLGIGSSVLERGRRDAGVRRPDLGRKGSAWFRFGVILIEVCGERAVVAGRCGTVLNVVWVDDGRVVTIMFSSGYCSSNGRY